MTLLALLYAAICIKWSVVMLREVRAVADGDALTHALLTFYACATAIFYGILGGVMFVRREPIRRERRLVGYLLPLVVVLLMGMVGQGEFHNPGLARSAVATLLVVNGTLFTLYALRHLGRHFGVVSDVRGLVTSGPYRFARHPLYAGEAVTTLGILIAVATPVLVLAFAAGIGVQIWRARIEERALASVFPSYHDYAARTPMLVPVGFLTNRQATTLASPAGD